jgi:MFS family permease
VIVSAYIQLLRKHPDFARLWLAQVISLLGDWFSTIVLSTLVAEYSKGTPYEGLAVSGFLLARFAPPLLISPFAGVMVDRFNRKWLLIASDILRSLTVLLFLVADSPDKLWLIYVLTIVQFGLSAVFEPGKNAITPSLVERDGLVVANTLSGVTWSVMLAAGAVLGGLIAAQFGRSTAILLDALSFAVSALLIWQIQTPVKTIAAEAAKNQSDANRFIDGLRYALAHPGTSAALLVKMGLSLGNIDALLIVYGTQLFVLGDDGTRSLSIMYSAFGVGAVLGPLLINRFMDGSLASLRKFIAVGYVLVTIGWFLFGSASTLPLVALALIVRAMGGSINWTYSSVIIQKSTPNEFLGRMFSLDMACFQLATALSIIATGAAIDAVGSDQLALFH